ncbi:GDSL-type esterase/lipase family protein [Magnetospirillum moscoviense]|uniref:SGNH hydrolase-type esterase domain-containing protein n=1 Tax=Magnetospirillum moscoviense TaxID=1437059 RepID=A0A178MZC3_9PROT|nr:GDSL-type esterase/lipase family protein [Magnetospirillum moscoviense]OAN55723.1 hypothetical protein A6A05_08190 [Magnetospirillum moscoviense]
MVLLRLALVAMMAVTGVGAALAAPQRKSAAPTLQTDSRKMIAPQALAGFYRDLARLEAGEIDHLHILQLGDSHTAGDVFSGRLRSRFQQMFGAAGRGAMPPGKTFPGIRQKEVSLAQGGAWTMRNSKQGNPDDLAYGLSGFVAVSGQGGGWMQVSPTEDKLFQSARIDFLHAEVGGAFEVLLDGEAVETVSTEGPDGRPGHVQVAAPHGARTLGLATSAPDVRIKGWSLLEARPGVLVESFGIVGATVRVVERWHPASVAADLEALRPTLVILAYGTNEGFEVTLDLAEYRATFARVLGQWRRRAPILVAGPPDGRRAAPACKEKPKKGKKPAPCRWFTPANLPLVRAIQRQEAQAAGAAFWDWSAQMPEPGGIERWVKAEPPMARGDYVHFTTLGYESAADALFEQLMDGYAQFKAKSLPVKPR